MLYSIISKSSTAVCIFIFITLFTVLCVFLSFIC
nr:MAG TPA: hypothetical protein [Crassvirales sp.]